MQARTTMVVEGRIFRHAGRPQSIGMTRFLPYPRPMPQPGLVEHLWITIPHRTNICSNRRFRTSHSTNGHGRRIVIPAPTFGIGDVHLITQHIPDYARLLPRIQCLNHRHAMQFGQALVMGQRSAIAPPEHLFKQLPKFAFLHAPKCTQSGPHTKRRPASPGAQYTEIPSTPREGKASYAPTESR
ncbi:hypothetical protein HMPREF1494_0475 [Bifidobacterium sp. MSTE12]|nr:hypothetical protein HMPREF1494_0475 [Bifidobacterium sp. MSTE12]